MLIIFLVMTRFVVIMKLVVYQTPLSATILAAKIVNFATSLVAIAA